MTEMARAWRISDGIQRRKKHDEEEGYKRWAELIDDIAHELEPK